MATIAELRAMEEMATRGPWRAETRETCTCDRPAAHGHAYGADGFRVLSADHGNDNGGSDVRAAVEMRNHFADLLAVAETAKAIESTRPIVAAMRRHCFAKDADKIEAALDVIRAALAKLEAK